MTTYTNFENDDNFRPYHAGMSNRDPSMGCIVIFQKLKSTEKATAHGQLAFDGFKSDVGNGTLDLVAMNSDMSWISNQSTIPDIAQDMGKIMATNNKSRYYGVFNNFSLASVSEAREELVKINLNFGGSWTAFFFGENPRVFTFQGILLDSPEYPYYQEFLAAYDTRLSGRKAIAFNTEIVLTYDGRIVSGYLLKLMSENSAENYNFKSFAFTVLVKYDSWFRYNINAQGDVDLNAMDNSNRYTINLNNDTPGLTPASVAPASVAPAGK